VQAQGIWSAGPGDDEQRFLADLRALRDAAALGYDELAARTHYPDDILRDADTGPSLPGLPVLAAYVRACDGDVPEWEERWRRLGFGADADPGLPARPAGASPAAEAGARASVGVAPPDAYDPDRIRAVLRGIHQPEQTAASRGSAAMSGAPATVPSRPPEYASSWSAGASQDLSWSETASPGAGEDTVRLRSGWDTGYQAGFRSDEQAGFQHRADDLSGPGLHRDEPSGLAGAGLPVAGTPDEVQAEAIRRDPFSADWLQDSELASGRADEYSWSDQPAAAPTADSWFSRGEASPRTAPTEAATETWFAPQELTGAGATRDAGVTPPVTPDERAVAGMTPSFEPGRQADAGLRTPSGYRSPSDYPPQDGGRTGLRAAWPEPADNAAAVALGAADRTVPASRPEVSLASAPAGPAAGSGALSGPARERPSGRVSLARLLVVIVVAAIIGSVLVLVLH
jgi:hypothetical protein